MKDLVDTHETMRFDVEGILIDARSAFGDVVPTCLSQSHRAKAVLTHLKTLSLSQRAVWLSRAAVLEDFIVLNQAIRILER